MNERIRTPLAGKAHDDVPGLLEAPFSSFASVEAQAAWTLELETEEAYFRAWRTANADQAPDEGDAFLRDASFMNAWYDENHFLPLQARMERRYSVRVEASEIAGVPVEIFTPVAGIDAHCVDSVLLNLHGGGFLIGARTAGRLESIPIAALSGCKVISVDYRQGLEHRFPAATEDVVAVYAKLLEAHSPERIGIYGCSSGGMLTAQVVAWLLQKLIPIPGGIAMICGTGELFAKGDSAYIWGAFAGRRRLFREHTQGLFPYLADADPHSPLLFPMRHPQSLTFFPASLLISGSRCFDLSTLCDAHNKLTATGVQSRLHVWDGMAHAFIYHADVPEAQQAHRKIAEFFSDRLQRPWYADEMHAFLDQELVCAPDKGQTLFLGSSSIRLWDTLERDMAPFAIIKRGFGGARIVDILTTFDRIVAVHAPQQIVFYAGENDLAWGAAPDELARQFEAFMNRVSKQLPGTRVGFVSVKPSPGRSQLVTAQGDLNDRIRRLAAARSDLDFIDVASAMCADECGTELKSLYLEDGVHMNAAGYRLWSDIIRTVLLRWSRR